MLFNLVKEKKKLRNKTNRLLNKGMLMFLMNVL